jgi:hypothetical protein
MIDRFDIEACGRREGFRNVIGCAAGNNPADAVPMPNR